MSSRSLAAARSRRAGENAPPVSGNRPGTSIGSHAAFAPQQQTPQGYNHNMQPNNVRTARPVQQQQQQETNKPALPFTKLSISDAIGLVTLRLGRVEQWIIDTEHENEENEENYGNADSKLPENSKIIDSSILNNIVSRLDSIEKKETGEDVSKLSENISKMNEQLNRIADEGNKHTLAISKHTEQLFKFERELVETKDILKTFMIKYDMFASETNNKFVDYEFALSELEKSTSLVLDTSESDTKNNDFQGTNINDINEDETGNEDVSENEIKNELENEIENEIENENEVENEIKNEVKNEVANIMSHDLKKKIKKEIAFSK